VCVIALKQANRQFIANESIGHQLPTPTASILYSVTCWSIEIAGFVGARFCYRNVLKEGIQMSVHHLAGYFCGWFNVLGLSLGSSEFSKKSSGTHSCNSITKWLQLNGCDLNGRVYEHFWFSWLYYVPDWPPLWSSGQSTWLQIRRPGFDSRHYKKKKVVGLERGPLSLVSTTEELLDRKVAAAV
jgi:hypothetical protein